MKNGDMQEIFDDIENRIDSMTKEDLAEHMCKLSAWLAFMAEELSKKELAYNASQVAYLTTGSTPSEAKVRARACEPYKAYRKLEIEFDATKEMINSLKRAQDNIIIELEKTKNYNPR